MTKVPIDRATIQAVAQLIVQKFDPEQIILFGSHARGNAGSHSDIDLLVVLKSPRRLAQTGTSISSSSSNPSTTGPNGTIPSAGL